MQTYKYIYSYNYDITEGELCKLETKYIFNREAKDKLLFSNQKVEPSHSAFIRNRLDIISLSADYSTLINEIKQKGICSKGFKVEYLVFEGDTTEYTDRLQKLRDIGFSIEGNPDYYNPTTTYALCKYGGIWYFSISIRNNNIWHKHKEKPCSFSNSLGINIAKALVNIATKANKEKTLLDACCGVGTIMLEACFAGHKIEGCDINEKTCNNARENLAYFNYTANIYHSDIKDISKRYEAAIIDLPYNLFTSATDNEISHIIESTAKITDRLVIVSISDITSLINNTGFKISDYCNVSKSGKRKFARKVWVCERNN
ncbi:TRM11 family methyltransferase [Ancylomarina sp. 16SWW S1-10-2]|uniref:TRM11 family SAM-dependent methyltransferase n=1 Tax=Ancylomarina sp. 16SWW S1-10-2 TaxID=2499681 RepID=UPI0012ADA742|nr:methyltransferase [Ancylomarina sp. 16SWW S1-10-2]MRT92252.1 SAM-dependent methyltransferase [Ancylomarina sp. 16SWW S1-10-2]